MIHRFNILKIFLTIALSLCGVACDDEVKTVDLDFVGDSIIRGWKVVNYFPEYNPTNHGVNGARIDYLEELAGQFTDRTVVLILGTNNRDEMVETKRADYVKRYIDAIVNLNAGKLYLFSVFPRDRENDAPTVNEDIRQFNLMVQNEIKSIPSIEYIDIYNDFLDNGKVITRYFYDGLHPSPDGYDMISAHLAARLPSPKH